MIYFIKTTQTAKVLWSWVHRQRSFKMNRRQLGNFVEPIVYDITVLPSFVNISRVRKIIYIYLYTKMQKKGNREDDTGFD